MTQQVARPEKLDELINRLTTSSQDNLREERFCLHQLIDNGRPVGELSANHTPSGDVIPFYEECLPYLPQYAGVDWKGFFFDQVQKLESVNRVDAHVDDPYDVMREALSEAVHGEVPERRAWVVSANPFHATPLDLQTVVAMATNARGAIRKWVQELDAEEKAFEQRCSWPITDSEDRQNRRDARRSVRVWTQLVQETFRQLEVVSHYAKCLLPDSVNLPLLFSGDWQRWRRQEINWGQLEDELVIIERFMQRRSLQEEEPPKNSRPPRNAATNDKKQKSGKRKAMGRPPVKGKTGKSPTEENEIFTEWESRERGVSMEKFAQTKSMKLEKMRLLICRVRDRNRK